MGEGSDTRRRSPLSHVTGETPSTFPELPVGGASGARGGAWPGELPQPRGSGLFVVNRTNHNVCLWVFSLSQCLVLSSMKSLFKVSGDKIRDVLFSEPNRIKKATKLKVSERKHRLAEGT